MRYLNLLAFLLIFGLTPSTAQAAKPPKKPIVILFVGNSFFHGARPPVLNYNATAITDENYTPTRHGQRYRQYVNEPGPWGGIPGIFKKMTDEAGLNYEVHIEAISGQSFQFHYDSVLAVIKQPKWDEVVMHDLSTGPLPTRHGGEPVRFYTYGTRLEQAVHEANPAAKIYLYETWANAQLTYTPGATYAGRPLDSMTHDLHAAYYGLARQDGHFVGVAPAGDAWLRAIGAGVAMPNPYAPDASKMNLWAPDGRHPSQYGAYLNACVLFAELTGRDPRALGASEQAAAALGITPTEAANLQRVAYEQVQASKKAADSKPKERQKLKK